MNKKILVISTSLQDKQICFCKDCLACQKTGRCMIEDDMEDIRAKMLTSDVIVFATSVYFYEMCGQMKTMIDRSNPLFASAYTFREIYLLAVAADIGDYTVDRTISGLQGWIDCFDGVVLQGVVFCGVVTVPGDIKENDVLNRAYELGKKV